MEATPGLVLVSSWYDDTYDAIRSDTDSHLGRVRISELYFLFDLEVELQHLVWEQENAFTETCLATSYPMFSS